MDHPPNPSSSSESHWQLRVLNGPLHGAVYALGQRFTIGRASGCDLQLTHEGVSRQHAHIAVDDRGHPILVDMVSGNGCFIDGRRVEREVLRPHAIVRIADTELVFEPVTEPGATERVLHAEGSTSVTLVGPDGVEHDGRRLDEIIEYRTLRALTRRGGLNTEPELVRYAELTAALRQPEPRAESEPEPGSERRTFCRFTCSLPATLRLATGTELSGEIIDLGVDGAKLYAPDHGLEFDEIVWLSLLLEADGRVQEQVLAARIAWVSETELGIAFAGAPRSTKRARPSVTPSGFDANAPTVRIDVSPGKTQNLGLIIGTPRSRARHWS